jgi:hypothetical protein
VLVGWTAPELWIYVPPQHAAKPKHKTRVSWPCPVNGPLLELPKQPSITIHPEPASMGPKRQTKSNGDGIRKSSPPGTCSSCAVASFCKRLVADRNDLMT